MVHLFLFGTFVAVLGCKIISPRPMCRLYNSTNEEHFQNTSNINIASDENDFATGKF